MLPRLMSAALLALACCAPLAVAQTTPAKKALVDKVITLQRESIEALARNMAEQSVGRISQAARQVIQSQAPDKREALGKTVDAELKKYLDETTLLLRDSALKVAPGTVGPLLEKKFSESELRTLVAWLESPVNKKYQQASPEFASALAQKIVADNSAVVDPKLKALEDRVANVLGLPPRPSAASTPPAASAPAPAASKAQP